MPHPLAGPMKRVTSDNTDQWETAMVRSDTSGPPRRRCADATTMGWAPMDLDVWWLAVVARRTLKRNEPTQVWSTWTPALLVTAVRITFYYIPKKIIKLHKTNKKA